jgi:predicted dinucleotide-binding enzyme
VTIGILGTGRVAQALGSKLVAAGRQVVLGSRDPDARRPDALPGVKIVSHREAAAAAGVLVNALPGDATLDALTAIGEAPLFGKVLLDVANAIDFRNGRIDLLYPNGSLAEEIQKRLPATRVVKSLNTMSTLVMVNPTELSGPSTIFLSGDDAAAKDVVKDLLGDLGWPAEWILDLGDISTARGPEHAMPLLAAVFGALGTPRINLAVVR